MDFVGFPKIPRLDREIIITEKIDGTNAQIYLTEAGEMLVGSRTRWLGPGDDNFGFYAWAKANEEALRTLGTGHHFGEWWGGKIQRGYGLKEKRFSLFNTTLWGNDAVRPACCHVVPLLYQGQFSDYSVTAAMNNLRDLGSYAATGYMNPEGIIIYHTAGNLMFKKTFNGDTAKGAL